MSLFLAEALDFPCLARPQRLSGFRQVIAAVWRGDLGIAGGAEGSGDETRTAAGRQLPAPPDNRVLLDPLTAVGNRRCTEEVLLGREERFRRDGTPYTLLSARVDHFAAIGERFGGRAGDAVLIAVARTLESNLGTFDFLGRRRGEEFLAVLASAEPEWASEVAGRCCGRVRQCQVDWGGAAIRPTISVGVAIRRSGESEGDLLRRADANLDLARQSGGNRHWGP